MRPIEIELRRWLGMVADFLEAAGVRSLERVVLTHGRAWSAAPLPPAYAHARGVVKECFQNAAQLAFDEPALTYVEGFAHRYVPTLHAWCVDSEGRVVDPTWRDELLATWRDAAYVGIPFDTTFVRRRVLKTKKWGLLYDGGDFVALDPGRFVAQAWRAAPERIEQ